MGDERKSEGAFRVGAGVEGRGDGRRVGRGNGVVGRRRGVGRRGRGCGRRSGDGRGDGRWVRRGYEEDRWEEVSGDDRCRTCVRDDTVCVVNTTAIRRWREAVEAGKATARAPTGTSCKRCNTALKRPCHFPGTADLREAVNEKKAELAAKKKKAEEEKKKTEKGAAGGSKRKVADEGVAGPSRKKVVVEVESRKKKER